jgi:hypothetical protein
VGWMYSHVVAEMWSLEDCDGAATYDARIECRDDRWQARRCAAVQRELESVAFPSSTHGRRSRRGTQDCRSTCNGGVCDTNSVRNERRGSNSDRAPFCPGCLATAARSNCVAFARAWTRLIAGGRVTGQGPFGR